MYSNIGKLALIQPKQKLRIHSKIKSCSLIIKGTLRIVALPCSVAPWLVVDPVVRGVDRPLALAGDGSACAALGLFSGACEPNPVALAGSTLATDQRC